MAYKQAATIAPWSSKGDCSGECVGCEHLINIHFWSNNDIDIDCDLDED